MEKSDQGFYCKYCKVTYIDEEDFLFHKNILNKRKCYWKKKDEEREYKLLIEQQKLLKEAKERYQLFISQNKKYTYNNK